MSSRRGAAACVAIIRSGYTRPGRATISQRRWNATGAGDLLKEVVTGVAEATSRNGRGAQLVDFYEE